MTDKSLAFQGEIYFLDLKTFKEESGNLSIVEATRDLPFEIKRIFYIWNTKTDSIRGRHAHKTLVQAFIAMHGSCELVFDNGSAQQVVVMNDPSRCLVVPPGNWLEIKGFADDCVLMVLASEYYDEAEYIRNYEEYLEYVQAR